MDFELSDEQRLLKDSVERLTTQRYDFETRKKFMAEPDGWSRDMWRQYAELGLTALPVRRRARRHRRRAGRDHDRDGGVRPRARAGALSGDRGARRRLPASRRERCREGRTAAQGRGGRGAAVVRPHRTAGALRSRRCGGDGQEGRRRLRAQRREEPRRAWRLRRQAHRLGARLGRRSATRTASGCSSSTPNRMAFRAAAIRPWTACAPPKSPCRT